MEHVHEENRNGLIIRIIHDSDMQDSPDDWGDDSLFLVHYHREFEIRRDKIVTKNEIAEWYRRGPDDAEQDIEKDYFLFPVAAYIHSGVVLSLGDGRGFPDFQWDVSHVGAVLASRKEFTATEDARRAAEALVKTWNDCLSGNVYGFEIQDSTGRDIESCWGFYGDYNADGGALSEARSIVDHVTNKGKTDASGQILFPFAPELQTVPAVK